MNLVFLKIGYLEGGKRRLRRVIGHNGRLYCCSLEEEKEKNPETPQSCNSGKSGTENRDGVCGSLPLPSCLSYAVCLDAHWSVEVISHSAFGNMSPKKSA